LPQFLILSFDTYQKEKSEFSIDGKSYKTFFRRFLSPDDVPMATAAGIELPALG
jgi:hypothetical protein